MDQAFGVRKYIKVDPVYAKLLGFDEYLFYFRARVPRDPANANAGVSILVTDDNQLWLTSSETNPPFTENFHFRPALAFLVAAPGVTPDPDDFAFVSSQTLFNCDTRQYLDVTFSAPHIAQICVLNGAEQHKKILARFPLKDFLDTEHITFNDYDTYGVRETINLGLEDLTKGNPDAHTMLLLPGEVAHANVQVETTYLQWDVPKSKYVFLSLPTDFGTHGFWSLKLILAKKIQ
jgi:hypothetical protein